MSETPSARHRLHPAFNADGTITTVGEQQDDAQREYYAWRNERGDVAERPADHGRAGPERSEEKKMDEKEREEKNLDANRIVVNQVRQFMALQNRRDNPDCTGRVQVNVGWTADVAACEQCTFVHAFEKRGGVRVNEYARTVHTASQCWRWQWAVTAWAARNQ